MPASLAVNPLSYQFFEAIQLGDATVDVPRYVLRQVAEQDMACVMIVPETANLRAGRPASPPHAGDTPKVIKGCLVYLLFARRVRRKSSRRALLLCVGRPASCRTAGARHGVEVGVDGDGYRPGGGGRIAGTEDLRGMALERGLRRRPSRSGVLSGQ